MSLSDSYPPNAQVNPRVPTGDMIYQTRTAAHVGLNRLLGVLYATTASGVLLHSSDYESLRQSLRNNEFTVVSTEYTVLIDDDIFKLAGWQLIRVRGWNIAFPQYPSNASIQ